MKENEGRYLSKNDLWKHCHVNDVTMNFFFLLSCELEINIKTIIDLMWNDDFMLIMGTKVSRWKEKKIWNLDNKISGDLMVSYSLSDCCVVDHYA